MIRNDTALAQRGAIASVIQAAVNVMGLCSSAVSHNVPAERYDKFTSDLSENCITHFGKAECNIFLCSAVSSLLPERFYGEF